MYNLTSNDAEPVATGKLILGAVLSSPRAVGQGRILVGAINAIRISITDPLLLNAAGPSPLLVLLALELCLGVTGPGLTLCSLVRVVQAIIVVVTNLKVKGEKTH